LESTLCEAQKQQRLRKETNGKRRKIKQGSLTLTQMAKNQQELQQQQKN